MQARLEQHKEKMAQWASQLPTGTRVAFGTSREQLFNLHTQETWTGSVLASLGLNVPAAMAGASMPSIGLEQLLAVNPAWLLVAHYREESIVKRWQQDPLWQILTAAQKQQVASVDSNAWARMRGIFAAERIAADTVKNLPPSAAYRYEMTALKTPGAAGGLPVAVLIIIFWLSLFCYSAIPVSGADAIRALLPGHTPTLPEALVQNLRLPRSLVAVLIGASLALAGTLLQTLTHNPMASPSLLGINSGAALAMALTSALSPTPVAGYSLSFIAACGGGVSWLLVMTAGGGFRHTQDRNKLILAGIALSAFCMALTRITLLLAEDHAYGIFYWLAGGVSHAHWQDVWQLLPVVVTAVPVVLLLANQLNLLNVSDSTAHTLGVNLPRLRLIINMLVLLLVGACVSVAGPVAFIGLLVPHLARFWAGFDQRNVLPVSMLLGGHADADGRCTRTRAGLPRRSARRRSAGADWQSLLCLAGEEARMKIALVIFITLALAGCALLSPIWGVIPVPWRALLTDWQDGREHYYVLMEYRLPRLLLALFVGAALAVAGVLVQGIVRNPLASPDILGINHAASLASVGALLLMPSLSVMVLPLLAFAGGMAGLILLKMLARPTSR